MIFSSICLFLPAFFLAVITPQELDSGGIGWRLILALFLVLLNGFFVAAEFAIVKVRASQIEI